MAVQTFPERMLGFIRTKNCKILWELLHGIYIRDEQIWKVAKSNNGKIIHIKGTSLFI